MKFELIEGTKASGGVTMTPEERGALNEAFVHKLGVFAIKPSLTAQERHVVFLARTMMTRHKIAELNFTTSVENLAVLIDVMEDHVSSLISRQGVEKDLQETQQLTEELREGKVLLVNAGKTFSLDETQIDRIMAETAYIPDFPDDLPF